MTSGNFRKKKSRRVSIVFMFSIDFPSNYKHVHQLAIWSRMFEGTQWPIAEGRGLQAERGVVTPWVFDGDWCCKSTLLAFEHFIESGKLKANLDAELLRSRGRLDERESDFKLNHPNSPNCFSNISYKATWKNMGLDQDMFKTVKFDHGEIDCYWNKDWLSHSVLDGVLQLWIACCRPDYFKRCPQTKRKQKSIFEQINNKHFNENNILQGKI